MVDGGQWMGAGDGGWLIALQEIGKILLSPLFPSLRSFSASFLPLSPHFPLRLEVPEFALLLICTLRTN